MKVKEKKIDYSTALEELENDNIKLNPYDLFEAVNACAQPTKPKTVYVGENEKRLIAELKPNYWFTKYDKIQDWLYRYKELNKQDRLSLSDIVVTNCCDTHTHAVLFVVNGLNGSTQVSRQSLKHVMDIITYLEDYYGARAFISSTWYHSDVFYYTISIIIWKDILENKEYGNLKPLRHYND